MVLFCVLVLSTSLHIFVQSLVLLMSNGVLIKNILLYKDGMELPQFLLTYDMESIEDHILSIDSGRAYFDTILIQKDQHSRCAPDMSGGLTVLDLDSVIWQHTFQCGSASDEMFNITFAITATPLSRPRIVDVFPYNGDFVALFRVQYLFDSVDEFLLVEAATTFSGARKPSLLFTNEENTALFAPYMSKITYVVVEEFPPYPGDSNGEGDASSWLTFSSSFSPEFVGQLNSMLQTPNFWRANYQRLFSKFFLRPPSASGERQLILVTDCDELPNRTQFAHMHDRIRPSQPQQHAPIPLFMMFFYYNFNTVNPFSWLQPYAISTEGFLALTDMLSPRIPPPHSLPGAAGAEGGQQEGRIARHIEAGGWHMSYFMSFADIRRKVESIADQNFYNNNARFKTDQHIKHCIDNSLDLYLRTDSISQAWMSRANLQVTSFPEGWEQLQRQLELLQAAPTAPLSL